MDLCTQIGKELLFGHILLLLKHFEAVFLESSSVLLHLIDVQKLFVFLWILVHLHIESIAVRCLDLSDCQVDLLLSSCIFIHLIVRFALKRREVEGVGHAYYSNGQQSLAPICGYTGEELPEEGLRIVVTISDRGHYLACEINRVPEIPPVVAVVQEALASYLTKPDNLREECQDDHECQEQKCQRS